jgi:ribulose-5-phosphate 4-epimerase/fuculose-1-phosphate aldolase
MSVVGLSETRPEVRRSNLDHEAERADLACAFRWTARLNMHEGVANHFSYAVSDDGARFLMNPNGRHFSRIRASDLLLIDASDPQTMNRPDAPDPTAWALHGSIHRHVPQARCLMHVHSKYATVLAALADSSIPPIDQNTMRFYGRIAVDDGYDGMGLGDEAERVATLIGDKPILVMGNHGIMVVGETIAETFDELYYFERACETYICALMSGRPLRIASHEVAEKTMRQWLDYPEGGDMHLKELKAILDGEGSDYRM